MYELHNRDCLEVLAELAELADDSIDLVATDPPYYQVKDDDWDNQWASPGEFLDWLEQVVSQCARVLKPTGSLYLFASPRMAATVEVMIARHLRVENHLVWIKPSGMHKRQNRAMLRRFFPATERIIFAANRALSDTKAQHLAMANACSSIIKYFRSALADAGMTQSDINQAFGSQMAGHWFGRSQWKLPNEQQYTRLQDLLNGHLNRPYVELKSEVNRLCNTGCRLVKRPFDVGGREWYTDAWVCPPVQHYPGKHPCEKPMAMMKHIVTASSLPGGVVLDPFMGGGTTGVAAVTTGRKFLGCELDGEYFNAARTRISEAVNAVAS